MRKFFVLLKKELRELLTPQVILPMLLTLGILNAVGKLVGRERINSMAKPKAALADLDRSDASRAALAALAESGFAITELHAETSEEAVKVSELDKFPALIVIPKGYGAGLAGAKTQKVEVYSFLRALSLAASLKALNFAKTSSVINEDASKRLMGEKLKGSDPKFLRRPVSSTDFVVLAGKQAHIGIAQVVGFIQSQTTFIPVVMLMVIVIAAQMVATTVANEKENKTLETLLSLPVERNSIVFAKLSAAAIVAFLFAGVYLLGFRLYMQDVAGDLMSGGPGGSVMAALSELGLTLSSYGYIFLWISLFFGILCALSIAMILGLLAEDVKGAQVAAMPLVIMVLIPYLLTIMTDIDSASMGMKILILAIPFSHPFLAPTHIIAGRLSFVVGGIAYQAAVFIFFVTLATRLFSSEAVLTLKLRRPRFLGGR